MNAKSTKLTAGAKHKVIYEYRTLLGIIGDYEEVSNIQTGGVILIVEMKKQPEKIIVNGVEYIEK